MFGFINNKIRQEEKKNLLQNYHGEGIMSADGRLAFMIDQDKKVFLVFDENNKEIGNGYTLYLDFYFGYQFKFFEDRFFLEPANGISYWPLRTGVPESFKAVEQKWPNYFIQPGLDFGFKF